MYAKYDKFVKLHWTVHLAMGLVYFFGCWLIFRFPWPTLAGLCILLVPALKSKALAQWLIKRGLTPNHVTVVGFVLALAAFWPLANGYLQLGIMIYLVSVLLDVLDGFMARLSGLSSQKGGFLDSVLDRIADTCLMGALVLHFVHQSQTLWATATLVALTGAYMVSYTRAKAEIFLPICDVGFMGERPDRNFIMISTVIWGHPEWGVVVVMIAAWLTAIRRMKFAWDRLEGPADLHGKAAEERPEPAVVEESGA